MIHDLHTALRASHPVKSVYTAIYWLLPLYHCDGRHLFLTNYLTLLHPFLMLPLLFIFLLPFPQVINKFRIEFTLLSPVYATIPER